MLVEIVLDPPSQKDFDQFAAICFPFESEAVAGQLLGDRACALTNAPSGQIFQTGAQNSPQGVAVMLIETGIFNRDHSIHQIARNLVVGNRLPVFDVDLSEDFAVAIKNHAGGLHLLHLVQVEDGGLVFEIGHVRFLRW